MRDVGSIHGVVYKILWLILTLLFLEQASILKSRPSISFSMLTLLLSAFPGIVRRSLGRSSIGNGKQLNDRLYSDHPGTPS